MVLTLFSYALVAVGAIVCSIEEIVAHQRVRLVLRQSRARSIFIIAISAALVLAGSLVILAIFRAQTETDPPLVAALALLASGLLLRAAIVQGADGSDRMLVYAGLGMFTWASLSGPADGLASLAWAGFLLVLSMAYFESGYSKIRQPVWRTGRQLALVLNMKEFGHPGAARILFRYPVLAVGGSWGVILIELLAGPLLLTGSWVASSAAVLLVCMHLSIGVLMGLGRFIYPFVGALGFLVANHPW